MKLGKDIKDHNKDVTEAILRLRVISTPLRLSK